jgi:hypothetical protein
VHGDGETAVQLWAECSAFNSCSRLEIEVKQREPARMHFLPLDWSTHLNRFVDLAFLLLYLSTDYPNTVVVSAPAKEWNIRIVNETEPDCS